eukprot:TRINITY_DN7196_c0_g1_i1.p3 TRINITY_DN7196_c0_g1~~TRINITY_DN7196_c0_g1_i1.p3  ORF type:complete len:167 (-),score=67.72 TRINITY_DN7196_c0_g1_i1:584-1084(-)
MSATISKMLLLTVALASSLMFASAVSDVQNKLVAPVKANDVSLGTDNTDLVLAMQQCEGVTAWTLHGLWPNWGTDCTSEKFDISQVASIEANMTKYWMSCPEYNQSNEEFWSHEWSKHGTCLHGASQLQFFTLGLQLLQKYTSTCKGLSGTCDTCLTPSYTVCSRR